MPLPRDLEKRRYMFTDDIKFLQKIMIFHPKEHKFLALRRKKNEKSRPNCWDLPGGNVLFGELHMPSLKNEISEETGLTVEGIEIKQLMTNFENSVYYIFAGFVGKALSEDVEIGDEHYDFRWLNKEDFLKLKSANFLINFVKSLS